MPDYSISIDLNIYNVEAVKRAIYKFADKFSADLKRDADSLTISLIPKDQNSFDFENIRAQLLDEILDQDLRATIANETEDIRNVIVAKAFANVDIQ